MDSKIINDKYEVQNGTLIALRNIKVNDDLVIPDEVINIASILTIECYDENGKKLPYPTVNINSLKLPKKLKGICNSAINFFSIKKLILNEELEYIGCSTFENLLINEVDFSNCRKLTMIGDRAFQGNSLHELDLSKCTNLKFIGYRAFSDMYNLTKVKFPIKYKELSVSDKIGNFGSAFNNMGKLLRQDYYGEFVTPRYNYYPLKLKIGDYAFYSTGIKELYMENIELGEGSFERCKLLTKIYIGNKFKKLTIPNGCFADCFDLKLVLFDNVAVSIESNAFVNCIKLQAIIFNKGDIFRNIPSNYIERDAFESCSRLKYICFPDNRTFIIDITEKSFCNGIKDINFSINTGKSFNYSDIDLDKLIHDIKNQENGIKNIFDKYFEEDCYNFVDKLKRLIYIESLED